MKLASGFGFLATTSELVLGITATSSSQPFNPSRPTFPNAQVGSLNAHPLSDFWSSAALHRRSFPLTPRQGRVCTSDEQRCGRACIPPEADCCSDISGDWCSVGDYCAEGGCCKEGTVCSGEPTDCSRDSRRCGRSCMPQGGDCCDEDAGAWCFSGEKCESDGSCSREGDDDWTGRPVQTGLPDSAGGGRDGGTREDQSRDDNGDGGENPGVKHAPPLSSDVMCFFLIIILVHFLGYG